jgi:ribosomal protein S18 acetylase RimI-like enzyme
LDVLVNFRFDVVVLAYVSVKFNFHGVQRYRNEVHLQGFYAFLGPVNLHEPSSRVLMLRPSLEQIAESKLPVGWWLRPYEPGFEQYWLEVHLAAEKQLTITPELFLRVFGNDPLRLHQRQLYLFTEARRAVGTVTAWFGPDFPETTCGRVHYLAVTPEFQGQGLGKALLGESLRLLKQLRYATAYLATSSTKLAAIRLYLQAGFEPVLRTPRDRELWREILGQCAGGRNRA